MITSHDQFLRAAKVVAALEKRVKDGSATDAERARWVAGVEEVVAYGWADDTRPATQIIPPPPVDPVVIQFAVWFARVGSRKAWRATDWVAAAYYWWLQRGAPLGEELLAEVEEELERRGLLAEPEGMIVTDLEAA